MTYSDVELTLKMRIPHISIYVFQDGWEHLETIGKSLDLPYCKYI